MNAYVIEAKRTPIGRSHPEKGAFRDVRADELLAALVNDLVPRVAPAEAIEDFYAGCVGQHLEQGKNLARLSWLLAGKPDSIPGATINRLCASSLQAFHFAAMALESRQADVLLAGGVEHMHHVPMTAALGYNERLLSRYEFPFTNMGLTAERVAEKYGISRKEQDEFALQSHQKAIRATKSKHFAREILPITAKDQTISADQGPRAECSIEALAQLKTAFREGGTVTAGNSSQISDGASLTLLASREGCEKYGLKKRAEVVAMSTIGLDPLMMGMGPVPAVRKLLDRAGMKVRDIDLFEMNEAFASQSIACARELEIPAEKLNPSGGAIALGHPLGCTGTRLITTLLNGLEWFDLEWGVATMCVGHGQGVATLLRRIK